MFRCLFVFALFLVTLPCGSQQGSSFGVTPAGKTIQSVGEVGTRVVVLFFVASDCPVSDRTFPEMARLRRQYSARGVRFWFVYPNWTEDAERVHAHQAAFDAEGEALLDPRGALVRLGRVRMTPEVSILTRGGNSEWKAVYSGRIDDRFVEFGRERPQPTEHFAERAVLEALEGKPVRPASGTGVGCAILHRGKGTP